MSISRRDTLNLWAKSGNVCAFPGCHQELLYANVDKAIGQVCHIIAQSSDGPRGDDSFTQRQIDSESNLILLCPTHHALVDSDVITYTVEYLQQIKAEHEGRVRSAVNTGVKWKSNISQFCYLNIPRIITLAELNGIQLELDDFESKNSLHALGFGIHKLIHRVISLFGEVEIKTLNYPESISILKPGNTIDFSLQFRTKGMPSICSVDDGEFKLTGDIKRDPHIYNKSNGVKLTLTLDPRWVTFTTAFSMFCSGTAHFAGLAFIKSINEQEIIASPYYLGTP